MGRAKKKYRQRRRAEKALLKAKEYKLLSKEEFVIDKMRAVYAPYGKRKDNTVKTNRSN